MAQGIPPVRHAVLWVLFAAQPKGAEAGSIVWSDQNELLYHRDKALHQTMLFSDFCFVSHFSH